MADILTFSDLQGRFLRWIDEGTDTGTSRTLAQDAINAAQKRILGQRLWPFMKWPMNETFQTVTGQQAYALHPRASRLLFLYDTDRRIFIPALPRREWPAVGVQAGNSQPTGVAVYGFIFGSYWPVPVQPPTAAALSIVSSSAGDTSCSIYLEGEDSAGNFVTETVILNGMTPVSSVNTFKWITALTKIGTFLGTITISSGSTTVQTLAVSSPGQLYPTIEFIEAPQGGRNMLYSFMRPPRTLVNDNDIPDIPYPWSEILVYDALLDLTTYNTELGEKEQTLWKARYDTLWQGLTGAFDEGIAGSYPRFVRDLDASGPSNRVWNYAP